MKIKGFPTTIELATELKLLLLSIIPKYSKFLVVLIIVYLFIGLFTQDIRAADGDLDSTFSGDGKVTSGFGSSSGANDIAIQSDGKIVAVGAAISNGSYDFELVRLNSDGSADNSFGGSLGIVTTDFGNGPDFASAVAIQGDGKIIVAGSGTPSGDGTQGALARYNIDGTLDITFDSDGKLFLGNNVQAISAVTIQPDGKIIIAGSASSSDGTFANFFVARLNSDGSLDTSFGISGKVITDFSNSNDIATDLALQTDGKIVLVGWTEAFGQAGFGRDFATTRYNSDGNLDSSFGSGGKVVTAISPRGDEANAVFLQVDGKIIVGGYSNKNSSQDFTLLRYNSDGSLDNSFDFDGIVTTDFFGSSDTINDVVVQSDGKIIAVGSVNNGGEFSFGLARYNTDGSLDASFGNNGKTTTNFDVNSNATAVKLQADRKIVVVGNAGNRTTTFALARYTVLSPTAASVNVSGKITNAKGRGIFRAIVTLTDTNGELRFATTNPFGYYRFNDVIAGNIYVFRVRHKSYTFTPQVLSIAEDYSNLNFTASEERQVIF